MVEIHTDNLHRIAYATDASIYRELPYGVAFPESEADIQKLVLEAEKLNTHIIPRAAGTSVAGQVVGSGIVADISRHLNKILVIDPGKRMATVQPGVVRDELNVALKPHGLFFSPETSTSNRCCIGGMFGNNSCGTHSLIYGSTRHHVVAAKGVLSDGSIETFKEYSVKELQTRFGKRFWEKDKPDSIIEGIYAQLLRFALTPSILEVIDNNYPEKTLRRRSCGYAIDEVIETLRPTGKEFEERNINLSTLLVGSEGTLAFITEITLSLDPLPLPHAMMLCVHCDTVEKCFKANIVALRHNPEAIELIDRQILKLSEGNIAQQRNRFFINGDPAGILCVELRAESPELLQAKAKKISNALLLPDNSLAYHITKVDGKDISRVYGLRKASLGLLNGMKGDTKPVGVIEDTAIPPERLAAFVHDLNKELDALGLNCVYYGHISTGELHLRPILNIKSQKGRHQFREIAQRTAMLVKKHRGSLSGEHGDGRLRGEFIPVVYGQEAYRLMKEVKTTWDPTGIFNIGKITDTPPMDSYLRFEPEQGYKIKEALPEDHTYFNWRAAFDECDIPGASGVSSQCHALMCSVEQCNGAGDCRKSNIIGGTMCPAFKHSGNELDSTRARANVLREILTYGISGLSYGEKRSVFSSPELKQMLDSCLACKGCRGECPSNVDITRLRAEILQQRYNTSGTPLKVCLVASMDRIQRLGRIFPQLYNCIVSAPFSSAVIRNILHFSTERNLPKLSRHSMRTLVRTATKKRLKDAQRNGKVFLFADEFTDSQEAELGLQFAELLMTLGYDVEIPEHGESGRAAISKGVLKRAKRCAERNVRSLSGKITQNAPLVGIEPSCILSFRDEYPDLVKPEMRNDARTLAKNCLLYDEFLLNEIKAGRISASSFQKCNSTIYLHGHCHQKALVGIEKTAEVLRLLLGAEIKVIPSGCCGMAGSFGYEEEHYRTSMEIGEMVLFPAIYNALEKDRETIIAAPGTSCRCHIEDGTGAVAYHPLTILYNFLIQQP